MSMTPAYFEDLHVGFRFDFPGVEITPAMREGHVALYGEDWPEEVVGEPQSVGVVPGPMLMSILGGQWGRHNMLAIKVLKSIAIRFHSPLRVGDRIECRTEVVKVLPHREEGRSYGYATIFQEVFNQVGVLCCVREIVFLVHRRT